MSDATVRERMPHVALLTQWYPPEPALQPRWIVDALLSAGCSCSVVTGIPNYPSGQVPPGYRAWAARNEVLDGVRVRRTPLVPSHDRSALGRLLNYASWAASSSLLGRGELKRADVVLVYSSPATAAAAAMATRRLHGTPYVLLVQDVWPDSVTQSGMLPPRLSAAANRLLTPPVMATYRKAAAVVAISPGMARLIEGRGVPREKISVLYNWVERPSGPVAPAASLRAQLGIPSDDFVLMYAGNHGAAQGLDAVVEAFANLPHNHHLVLVGEGLTKEALRARAVDLPHVHSLDARPSDTVRQWSREVDAHLVSLVRQPLFAVTVPSKLQLAFAEGKAVLAVGEGDVVDLVHRASAGVAAEPGDVRSIRAAVSKMARAGAAQTQAWGRGARTFYEEHMAPEIGGARLAAVLAAAAELD